MSATKRWARWKAALLASTLLALGCASEPRWASTATPVPNGPFGKTTVQTARIVAGPVGSPVVIQWDRPAEPLPAQPSPIASAAPAPAAAPAARLQTPLIVDPGVVTTSGQARPADLERRVLARIPPGTRVDTEPVEDWTHTLLYSQPRLGQGDVESTLPVVQRVASQFTLHYLANVTRDAGGYRLDKVAVGFGTRIGNAQVIVDPASARSLGAKIDMFAKPLLEENDRSLNEMFQIAKSDTIVVWDQQLQMLRRGQHVPAVHRFAAVLDASSGRLQSFVWLLDVDAAGGLVVADEPIQLLPPALREDRVLNVKGEFINGLGVPSKPAFGLVRIPNGTPAPMSPTLKDLAGRASYTSESLAQLESELVRLARNPA